MSTPRTPIDTVSFIDEYCAFYQQIFPDVRSFEQFKLFHVGLLSELPRKSIPAISKAVGLDDPPIPASLHREFTVEGRRVAPRAADLDQTGTSWATVYPLYRRDW